MRASGTGEELAVEVPFAARGDGPTTVLAIHGFGDNHLTWQRLTSIVPAREARVVAIDLPGFGGVPLPPPLAPHYTANAVELVRAVARHAPPPVVLLGSSLGAAVALGAAIREARGEDAAPPAAAVLLAPPSPETRKPLFVKLLRVPSYSAGDAVLRRLPERARRAAVEPIVRAAFRMMWRADADPPADWYESNVRDLSRPGALRDLEEIARDLLRVLDGEASELGDLLRGGGAVRHPVVVVRGERDPVIGRREARLLARRLPRGRYVEIPAVGHVPQNEAPEETARVLREVLAEIA